MKVLIAEDDSTSAIVLRKALEKLGHEAVVATDGERAYSLLSQDTAFEYRVVISDWMMPGMDGLELTRKLRAERKENDPYRFIVLLTARGRPEDRRQGLEAGADDFMVKPLDMGDLIPRLSVAERMLALEDAVVAGKNATPSPRIMEKVPTPDNLKYADWRDSDDVKEHLARDKDSPTLVVSPEDQAACATLFSALIDTYKATRVHFEPVSDGNYRLRIRTPQDQTLLLSNQPSTFSGTIAYLEAFLQSSPYGFARLPLSAQREVRLQIHKVEYDDGRRRYYVKIRREANHTALAPLPLESLPMSASVRQKLSEMLRDGFVHRGILLITTPVTSEHMLPETARAIRTYFADDQTILLDEYEGGPDYDAQHCADMLAQSPDIFVVRDEQFVPRSSAHSFVSACARTFVVALLPYGTVQNCFQRLENADKLRALRAGRLVGILGVNPLSADSSNAADRYELKTADELFPK